MNKYEKKYRELNLGRPYYKGKPTKNFSAFVKGAKSGERRARNEKKKKQHSKEHPLKKEIKLYESQLKDPRYKNKAGIKRQIEARKQQIKLDESKKKKG